MAFPLLHPCLRQALDAHNYTEPTPVQEAVLQPETAGRDLLVSAQTGSGKTVAYGLTLGEMLLEGEERFDYSRYPLALIVAPTRELALQVQRELAWLMGEAGGRVIACVGGMDIRREQQALRSGAQFVVGTPGRLVDHLERGYLKLDKIQAVVLDEADEMLDFGFHEELEKLMQAMPEDRRTLMFSATLPKSILGLARQYQHDALRIALTSEREPHGDIEYRAFLAAPRDTEHAVVNTLRFFDAPGALVFCATREAVRHLHANLVERGFSAVALSGEMKQRERITALQALRDGRVRVCVATDVAARGLDMPDLSLVVHLDLPQDKATLLHRSGRTGRAGRKGVSALIVPASRKAAAERMLHAAHIKANWSGAPAAKTILARDKANLVREIVALKETMAEEDLATGQSLLAELTPEQIAAILVKLRREQLPAPEVLQDPGKFAKSEEKYKSAAGKNGSGYKKFGGKRPGAGFGRKFEGKNFEGKKFEGKKFTGKKFGGGKFEGRKDAHSAAGKPGKKFAKKKSW